MTLNNALHVLSFTRGATYSLIVGCTLLVAVAFIPICGLIGGIMFVVETIKGVCIGIWEALKITGSTYRTIFEGGLKTMREMDEYLNAVEGKVKRGEAKNVQYD